MMKKTDVSLKETVSRADLTASVLGADWIDGLFTGNGAVSCLLSGVRDFTFTVNKTDVYQGFPYDDDTAFVPHEEVMRRFLSGEQKDTHWLQPLERVQRPGKPRHNVTPCVLRVSGFPMFGWATPSVPAYSGRVSLWDGTVYGEAKDEQASAAVSIFTPRGGNAVCIRFRDLGTKPFPNTWELVRPDDGALDDAVFAFSEDEVTMTQRFEEEDETYAVCVRFAANPLAENFRERTVLNFAEWGDADAFLVVRTSRDCTDPLAAARAEAKTLAARGFDALFEENAAWWHTYWKDSGIRLDSEPELDARCRFSQYVMACTFSRAPMPALSGLAYGPLNAAHPGPEYPWYGHDQNVQIALMAAMPTGHTELVNAMADTYLSLLPRLREHTKHVFGDVRGVCLPLCLSQNGGVRGGEYRYTYCGGAYSGLILVWAWRYGRNETQLREKLYPLLREFVNFYCSLLHADADGIYHLDATVPPEIFTLTRDDTCTLALLRPCMELCVETAERFGMDEEDKAVWQTVLAHYPPFCRHSDGGWWCGPDIPESHDMFGGHLFYPYFPAGLEPDEKAALATLAWYEKRAVERDKNGNPTCGWSCFNCAAIRLRTGGAEAFPSIYKFLRLFGKENGLFHHNGIDPEYVKNAATKRLEPPVIEGSSAILFLTCEALLGKRHGVLTLFPNTPENFTGGFYGLHTEDGMTVSAEAKDGKTVFCEITAPFDTVCTVRLSAGGETVTAALKANQKIRLL